MLDEKPVNDLLSQAEKYQKEGHSWPQIARLLDESDKLAENSPELKGIVRQRSLQLTRLREERIKTYLSQAAEMVVADPLDSEEVRRILRRASVEAIDEQATEQQIRQIEAKLTQRDEEQQTQQRVTELEASLRKLWDEGDEGFRTDQSQQKVVEEYFEKAFKLADQAVSHAPNFEPLQRLYQQAKRRHDEAREHASMAITYEAVGRFEDMLQYYEAILQEDPDRFHELEDEKGQKVRVKTRQAIELTKNKLSRGSQERVTDPEKGYLAEAQRYLKIHDPVTAKRKLQEARDLPYLDDTTLARINRFERDEVDPEVTHYQAAQRLAEDAIKADRLEKAWADIKSIIKPYDEVPPVVEARQMIYHRAQRELDEEETRIRGIIEGNRLEEADSEIRKLEQQRIYEEIQGKAFSDLLDALRNRNRVVEQEQREVGIFTNETLRPLVDQGNFEQANRELQDFLGEYPNAYLRHRELNRLYRIVESQVNVRRMPQRMQEAYNSADVTRLEEAIDDARRVIDNDTRLAEEYHLASQLQRLEGRLSVIQAKIAWEQEQNRTVALQELQTVLSSKAEEEDKQAARAIIDEIQQSQNLEQHLETTLPIIEAYLEQDQYLEAYEKLEAYISGPPIKSDLHYRRAALWGRITEGLIGQTSIDLTNMLDSASTDLDEFVRLQDRLQQLGARNITQLQNRAEERIAYLRALGAEEVREWQKACDYWQRALHFNESNVEYKRRFQSVQRQAINVQLNRLTSKVELLKEAETVADNYIQTLPDYIEPRLRYVDVLILQAYAAPNPEALVMAWQKAGSAYDLALYNIDNQDTAFVEIAEENSAIQKIKDLANTVDEGRKISRHITQLERILRSQHSFINLRSAVRQISDFMQEYPRYTGIAQWWQDERQPELIRALEMLADEHRSQYWVAFNDFARLLVVVPSHDEAEQQIKQMLQRVPELTAMVDNFCQDNIGYPVQEDTQVVEEQLQRTRQVNSYISIALDGLVFFTDKLNDPKGIVKRQKELITVQGQIQEKLQELEILNREFRVALNLARERGRAGYWEDFNRKLDDIQKIYNGHYSKHLAISTLLQIQQRLQQQRQTLSELIQQINNSYSFQNMAALKRQLNQLKTTDPHDNFKLHDNVTFCDPFSGSNFQGIDMLEVKLEEYDEQINALVQWLEPVIRHEVLERLLGFELSILQSIRTEGVLHRINRSTDSLVIHWQEHKKQHIELYRASSDFITAHQQTLAAIRENSFGSEKKPVSLQHGVEYLHNKPPVDHMAINSIHAEMLLNLGQELLRALEGDLRAAEQYAQQILNDAQEFIQLLNDFDSTYQGFVKSNKEEDRQRTRELHDSLKELVPNYTSLYEPEDYQLISLSKG